MSNDSARQDGARSPGGSGNNNGAHRGSASGTTSEQTAPAALHDAYQTAAVARNEPSPRGLAQRLLFGREPPHHRIAQEVGRPGAGAAVAQGQQQQQQQEAKEEEDGFRRKEGERRFEFLDKKFGPLQSGGKNEQLEIHQQQQQQGQQGQQQQTATAGQGAESSCEKLTRMARRSYFVTLLCLSLLVGASLLAAMAIGRQLRARDLDSSTSRQGRHEHLVGGAEEFEVRSFELVDLIEHDKSFAYTRWRLQVRVPKTAPAYEQRNDATTPASSADLRPAADGEPRESAAGEPEGAEEAGGTHHDGGPFQLTGTRNFVSERLEAKEGRNTSATQVDDSLASAAASDERSAESPGDPIQAAASELKVKPSAVNSSLVDCFFVDLEKRYGQKVAVETRHRGAASTRRVGFQKMRAIITACRLLTWASLKDHHMAANVSAPTQPPDTRRRLAEPLERPTPSVLVKRDQPAAGGPLGELIRPVEPLAPRTRAQTAAPAPTAPDSFGSLLGALVSSWSRPLNGTSGHTLDVQSAQQARPLPPPSAQVNASATDEEARRASYLNMGMSMMSGIVPNTLWCGLGDRAANYSELGAEFLVDSCCRAHDHCPIRLKPFTADYGLINWSMSTRSHCDCDLDFSECLTGVNSTLASVIKTLYFRFIGLQCIDLEARRPQVVDTMERLAPV